MRPIQPPRLKLRSARKGRNAMWVIKDREREISTGAREGERRKAEIALAEYLIKNRQPFFGDGYPHQVLIGDCLAIYCEKHGPTIARPRVSPLKSNGLLNSSVIVSSLNSHRNNATVMLHGAALKQTGVLPTARAERSNRRLPGVNSLRSRRHLIGARGTSGSIVRSLSHYRR